MDKLTYLFELQDNLQKKLGNFPLKQQIDVTIMHDTTNEYIRTQTLALIDELMEALRETPWKPWKKNQEYNEEQFQNELIDAWHFLINLTLASGMNSTTLFQKFISKNTKNHQRQDEGY